MTFPHRAVSRGSLWLTILLGVAALIGGVTSVFAPPLKTTALNTADFQFLPEGGETRAKIPRHLVSWTKRGFPATLTFSDGSVVPKLRNRAALETTAEPACRISDSNIYLNRALASRLQTPGDQATLRLSLDLREFAFYWSRPLAAGALLSASIWLLCFFWPEPRQAASSTARLAEFDALRGIAALGVTVAHAVTTFFPHHWLVVNTDASGQLLRAPALAEWIKFSPLAALYNGSMLVSVFWILSGLVLALPFLSKPPAYRRLVHSSVKRYFRLMPLAFFTTLLSFVLLETHALWHSDFILATGFTSDLLVVRFGGQTSLANALKEGIFFGHGFNGPLWTIRLEYFGSLLLFALLACTLRFRSFRRWLWILVSIVAWQTDQHFFVDFILGLMLADLKVSQDQSVSPFRIGPHLTWALIGACLIVGSASPGWLPFAAPSLHSWLGLPLIHLTALGLVTAVTFSTSFARLLRWSPLVWLGERSFALYAIHALLVATVGYAVTVLAIRLGIPTIWSSLLGIAVYLVVCLIVSEVLTRLLDQPSLRLANWFGDWAVGPRRKGTSNLPSPPHTTTCSGNSAGPNATGVINPNSPSSS